MGFIRAFKRRLREERGVALFMVLSSVAVLTILATEFTYMAQLNQRLAYDAADRVKAHYLAKSAFKISMLRLKAYQHVKEMMSGQGAAVAGMVPKGLVEKIWNFPLIFPLPTTIPGMTPAQKASIEKFQKDSSLSGTFYASIESESSKFNLNMILASFSPKKEAPKTPDKPKTPGAPATPVDPEDEEAAAPADPADKSKTPEFDPDKARKTLAEYLDQIFRNKCESDEKFQELYRDFSVEELVDAIAGWADRKYERRFNGGGDDNVALKRAPFYSVTELHMVPYMDDGLYELFAPNFTVSVTPGVNVNTINKEMLKALIPGLTEPEIKEFFEYRDKADEDNLFKKPDDFFKYIQNSFSVFRNSPSEVEEFKAKLDERNLRIITDESEFKISVQAQVNNVTKILDAWVTLVSKAAPPNPANPAGGANPAIPATPPVQAQAEGALIPGFPEQERRPESGLKVTFMRIY